MPPVAQAAAVLGPEVVAEPPEAESPGFDPWAWAERAVVVARLIQVVHDAIGWLAFRRQPAA